MTTKTIDYLDLDGTRTLKDNFINLINKKANSEDLTEHANDGDIHITAEERINWDSAVLYTEQTLTDDQKAQARANIGVCASDHTHDEYVKTNDVIAIENGGTGASTRVAAFENLVKIGKNPIASTAEDTPAKWYELGMGIAHIQSTTGIIKDQPSSYGILINYVYGGDIFQIWKKQANGPMYIRSSNASYDAWDDTWKRVITADDFTVSNGVLTFEFL